MNKRILLTVLIALTQGAAVWCMQNRTTIYLQRITNNTGKDLRITGFASNQDMYLKAHSVVSNDNVNTQVDLFQFFGNTAGRLSIRHNNLVKANINLLVQVDRFQFAQVNVDVISFQGANPYKRSYNFKGATAQHAFYFNLILEGDNLEESRIEYYLPEVPEA